MSKDPNTLKEPKTGQQPGERRPDFGKALGSSRHDEADTRDVARKAAKKSQHQNEPSKN
jgi:hypothetical protein